MQEQFLHFIWANKLLDPRSLWSTTGDPVTILFPGEHNTNAGPDFSNARIRIGGMEWAGDIEIHRQASEWYRHQHQSDPAYNNVILHVVHESDQLIRTQSGRLLPCLEIKNHFDPELLARFEDLRQHADRIPCAKLIHRFESRHWESWLNRLVRERLRQRSDLWLQQLAANKGHWEATYYHRLLRSFGQKVNALPFEQLARSLPYPLLAKHRDNLFQLESLLFGQAGFLNASFRDAYPQSLQREYRYLQHKYSLKPLKVSIWKFLRMRPNNFPTIRIAQFAALFHRQAHLFSPFAGTIRSYENLFRVQPSNYWQNHYHFDKATTASSCLLGKQAVHHLVINTVVPAMHAFGIYKQEPQWQESALALLHQLPAERHAVSRQWQDMGVRDEHAAHSQALLQLYQHYCCAKKCLQCAVGKQVLKG